MTLLLTLTITSIATYLKLTLTEEVEAMSAGLVACLGIFLSICFASFVIKLGLLGLILLLPKIKLV